MTLNMWQLQAVLLVVVLTIICSVNCSCDQIALPKCECKYPKAKRYEIDCQSRGLSSLPGKVNHTIADGDVAGNFSYNSIEKIPDFYFLMMKHFDVLDFTSNRIAELGRNSLAGLEKRLTTLVLRENRISSIGNMALREYIRLNTLDLGSNKISSPCKIHTADVMTYSLANNDITSLEDLCFSDSPRVESLDLSNNDIKTIGSEAFQGMSSLKTLDLGYNQLSDIGNGLNSLKSITSLESLSLRGNHLEGLGSICTPAYHLPYIKSLDVGYNDLKEIKIYCFTAYTTASSSPDLFLNFEYNKLTVLTGSAFAGLKERLTQLKLNHNQIREVSVNTFTDLRKLVKLDMDNNRIENLAFLKNWEDNALQELTVANNLISSLSPGVFQRMLKLNKLSLDGNLLLNIESAAFEGMMVLDDLSLRYNLLTNLEDGAFQGLDHLKKLRLTGNALVTLKNCTFSNLDRLVLFHFEDNLLHCDCDLHWLPQFNKEIDNRGVPDIAIAEPVLEDYCHYPKDSPEKILVNAVSQNCPAVPSTNACFGLTVTYDEPEGQAMNVSWRWDVGRAGSAIRSITLSQIEVETNRLVSNASVTSSGPPYELTSVEDDQIYKICVSIILANNHKETDCTISPSMIKKPTTTMAPTTVSTTPSKKLGAGSIAAICLGVLLIIIIVLLALVAIYLWKTGKYRHIMPTREYTEAVQADMSDNEQGSSPSSNGKSEHLDFRPTSEVDPRVGKLSYEEHRSPSEVDPMVGRPSYEEHDL